MAVWNTSPTQTGIPYQVYSVIDDTFVTLKHVETECDDLSFITLIKILSSQLDLVSFCCLQLSNNVCGVWILYNVKSGLEFISKRR